MWNYSTTRTRTSQVLLGFVIFFGLPTRVQAFVPKRHPRTPQDTAVYVLQDPPSSVFSSSSWPSDNNTSRRWPAVRPLPNWSAVDVARLCMEALQQPSAHHSSPTSTAADAYSYESALEVCFHCSSDQWQAAVGGSLEAFVRHTDQSPVFRTLVHCQDYEIVSVGPIIPALGRKRGAMQTVVMDVTQAVTVDKALRQAAAHHQRRRRQQYRHPHEESPHKHEASSTAAAAAALFPTSKRRFLWTLQQETRPPRQDCWLVHEVLFMKNAFQLTC